MNPQLIFFGYPSYLLQNTVNRLQNLVDNWIHNIEEDFDHIIILEGLFLNLKYFSSKTLSLTDLKRKIQIWTDLLLF